MKKNIALIAGGYTGEYVVSLGSAQTIYNNLDKDKYNVYQIVISKDGWFYQDENGNKQSVNKNDFSIQLGNHIVFFDAAYITVHGTPGEDGKLQGYLDMLHIPYTTCSAMVSALTMNKSFTNKVVKDFNVVNVADSVLVFSDSKETAFDQVVQRLTFPVFVKPNQSGSSLGISKVESADELPLALDKAFAEDTQVIVESFLKGRELTIGVYKVDGIIHSLPPTEVISKNKFFDYEAKYTPGKSEEITPALINANILVKLQNTATKIYEILTCSGVVRMDFIYDESQDLLSFLEVNTTPGQSANSLIPQQVRAAGIGLTEFYGSLLEEVLK